MLDRYSLGASAQQVADFFSIDPHGFDKPRYNAAPAQLLPIITINSPGLSHFYWGTVPQWAKNKSIGEKIINVRLEHIQERPTVRKTMRRNRCLVPADGFYGWKKVGKKISIPHRFELKPKALYAMAGLWDEFDDENGEMFHTFSIITCPANQLVSEVTERMPAILDKTAEKIWLSESAVEQELINCLQTAFVQLNSFTISPRINSIEVDDPTLIQPSPAADQFGNLTLFN